ncbi:aldehyde dehydrogenase family protein [Pseudonocardia sp. KRD-184]|uniref:Aldehyde dehydrogenase family protein n=1 Tax=Pseudonocardia oceani TaxID=2792013 RepID=A0ABS6U6J0_9PSEU|nr:aldehyde dehydrogenase family protein [Pseudonocardia oceani]MBW0091475.1 aldehyde dehydrogenase family protein [Pseudonocardia oceani]MBW0098595.1 aldehyde dehydrogenase family protein [Pseudonocardia oceani]MBW0111129.1 aldehyde dehydrogenase family protein [Pseudonocardia oceani]MBW0120715.1 aldehyde dehydrogenase family protein [Pseudonocardia oceani]MBW0127857.1 aldehyde dehydrogenase family protein [Pseudonocardia oceani]
MPTWEYSPAPESAALARLQPSYRPFVDGAFVDGGGEPLKTVNPATEEVLAEVGTASAQDVDTAVAAARRAQETTWGPMPGAERAKYLFRIARIVAERSRELAVLETLDNGKPIRESRDVDVPTASAHLFHHAGWADKLAYAGLGPDPRPVGVVGAVIPWNFPLLMATWKIAPALACGNTVVLKPAETTPLTALVLAEIAAEAGLPAGVLNVLPGAGDVGAALVGHEGLDKVAFTGSTDVGKQIQQRLAGTGRRLTLELGGKAANIVYDDAPIDQAVEGVVDGIFFNQGHVCCAGSRLLVQESIAEEFSELLLRRIETLRVGDPLDKNTDVGAINSRAQLDRIVDLAAAGDAEGAQRWTSSCPLPERGLFFPPTVFSGVEQTMRVAREEIFGPVLSVLTFRTPEEAVAKANNTPYGLSAGIWTEKGAKAMWTAQRLRAGVVWTNTFNRFDPTSPFGGYRESGFGREGGRIGLEAYLDA